MNPWMRFKESRWSWFLQGLPSVSRAAALFRARRYTMTTPRRCNHLWDVCAEILARNVPGDFVECGVWRGGSAGIMGLALQRSSANRTLHLFDSFEGLPEPTGEDGAYASEYSGNRASGALVSVSQCQASLSEVQEFLLGRLKLPRTSVQFHVGWFQNTIPQVAPGLGPIAVLRLDGDWYDSTRVCLEHLYPLLSRNGVIILDDYYAWEGCAKATEQYRKNFAITAPIKRIDQDAAFWEKI